MKHKIIILGFIFLTIIISFTTYLIFNDKTYEISFNSNGGNKIKAITIKKDTTLKVLPKPVKNGYEFLGWYLEDSLFDTSKPITENLTLKAKWNSVISPTYHVNFDTLSDNLIDSVIIEENEILNDIPIPIKEGYKFIGWFYHNKEFNFNTPITNNLTLVAKYEKEID